MRNLHHVLLLLFMLMLTSSAWAALPPISEESRNEQSSEVIRGEIRAIYSRKQKKAPDFVDEQLLLEIEVLESKKGSAEEGDILYVHCWVADQRPERWVGDGGQRPRPREGEKGVFFITGSKGLFRLLHPNGWEPER